MILSPQASPSQNNDYNKFNASLKKLIEPSMDEKIITYIYILISNLIKYFV